MACKSIQSSSSSSTTQRYDVFVSFRGEDIRNTFADDLFDAFQKQGIVAFRDDRNLKPGEHISTGLKQAIEGSQVLIVVFSKNYATSAWCLQELEKIVDCVNMEVSTGQSVLPVFYDVNPSEVRKQTEDYGKAFAKHEERFKEDIEMVQRWRNALIQVANLSGWDVQNKPQSGEIEKIVKGVMRIMGNKFSSLPNDLVGMHSHVEELEKFLVSDSLDVVRVVGIWGMAGIGKTTLARVLYDRISHQYDARCFIDDVSELYLQDYDSLAAQKQLLCQIQNKEIQEVWNLPKATYSIRNILSKVKAFIVLDNIGEFDQLEKLAVNRELLCAGTKIIIVSRNKHILEQFGVDKVYQVQSLNRDNALQLFCRKAFKCDDIMREYEELTDRALKYTQGHPLAIKVLGSLLFGRDTSMWKSALDRLRDDPGKEIMDVLRISFDGLKQKEKEIFLDIACFFNHIDEKYVKRVLNCCGFYPDIGVGVLIDKSLITIEQGLIRMHDLLMELGMKIVREKAPNEPRKWSRLWNCKDFRNVMLDKMAMEDLEAIRLPNDLMEFIQNGALRAEVLSKMSRLRLLILDYKNFCGSLSCLSNQLQYLEWPKYPFTYLPSSFEPGKLVELILPGSSIKRLWEDTKVLHNLRTMDLHDSKNLTRTPDFRGLTNLEQLNLEGCTKLVEIHPSIGLLRKLLVLNLKNCTSLRSLPSGIFDLSSLKVLNLFGCSKLFENKLLEQARHAEHLKNHDGSETAMESQSTSSILQKLYFKFFSSAKKKEIVGLLLPSFPCMQDLNLGFCNLSRIPDAIGCLHGLKRLNLGGNNFVSLPSSIKELRSLKNLNLEHCKQLKYLPEPPLGTDFPLRSEFVHVEYIPIGLHIFNCPKLVETESWSSIALSWMKQVVKVGQESRSPIECIDIVVPGSRVPGWFNMGQSFIRLGPVPLHDSNCIGLALCAAFVIRYQSTNLGRSHQKTKTNMWRFNNPEIKLTFRCESGQLGRHWDAFPVHNDLVKDELDHLYLCYIPREALIRARCPDTTDDFDGTQVKGSLEFQGSGSHWASPFRLDVENCGFRWVFKQDLELEELTPTMTNNDLSIAPFASKRKPLLSL